MLDPSRVTEVLRLQPRVYRLLKWLDQASHRDQFPDATLAALMSPGPASRQTLRDVHRLLPSDARPESLDGLEFSRFANLLQSYFEVSFEYDPSPRDQLRLEIWSHTERDRLHEASHLRPIGVTPDDKQRARQLERACLEQLSALAEIAPDPAALDALLTQRPRREQAALVAYVADLIRRCDGLPSGPWAVALWRTFAWTPEGSPRRDFALTEAAVAEAQADLRAALVALPPAR